MKPHIIYDLATFTLPAGKRVLAALYGDTITRSRGALARRWQSLAVGDEAQILQSACRLAAQLEDKLLEYKPKPQILGEDFIATVRKKLAKAAPLGQAFDHANHAKITGFCIQVERDAVSQWKAQDLDQAQAFLALHPVERTPFNKYVLEKTFPATQGGCEQWQSCLTDSPFMHSFAVLQGAGEF